MVLLSSGTPLPLRFRALQFKRAVANSHATSHCACHGLCYVPLMLLLSDGGLPLEFIGLLRQCFGTRFQLHLVFIVVFPTQCDNQQLRAYLGLSFLH